MNPTPLAQLLLLEQSGELTGPQRRALDAELAANPDARRLRDELRGLVHAIPPAPNGPAPGAAEQIAARLAQTKTTAASFRPVWKPVLAAAAALALLLGVQLFRGGNAPGPEAPLFAQADPAETDVDDWTDPLEDEFAELESLLLSISENPFDHIDL